MKIKNLIYNTSPIIFHAQGKLKFCPLWEKVKSICMDEKKVPNNIQIVTFNNGFSFENKEIGSLEKSIQNQCQVMGRNIKKWKNSMKIPLVIKFLENCNSDYVISLDSSDVVIYSLENILEKFLEKKCEMLFNAEINCWPSKFNFEKKWFKKPFCYLNAGAWIGKKSVALSFYKESFSLISNYTHSEQAHSEQACVKENYKNWYPKLLIDDHCSIFQTLNRVGENILKLS